MRRNKLKKGYLYRKRNRTDKDFIAVPYKVVTDVSEVGSELGKFLSENLIFTITKGMGLSAQTSEKNMVVLKSYDTVFEMEHPIYERYKEKIDQILAKNMDEAVEKYFVDGKTKIVVNISTSGCEYDLEETVLFDSVKINALKELYISYANRFDCELLKNIIIDSLGDDESMPKFLDSENILLQAGQRRLLFNERAYDLITDTIKEHERDLDKNGISKKMQMKLEG